MWRLVSCGTECYFSHPDGMLLLLFRGERRRFGISAAAAPQPLDAERVAVKSLIKGSWLAGCLEMSSPDG